MNIKLEKKYLNYYSHILMNSKRFPDATMQYPLKGIFPPRDTLYLQELVVFKLKESNSEITIETNPALTSKKVRTLFPLPGE